MESVFVAWGLAFAVLTIAAFWIGNRTRKSFWGIFVDARGRVSLTQTQIMLWTLVILSLIVGVFVGRLFDADARADGALNFAIPSELLLVMGISYGSGVISTAIKTNKDQSTQPVVATQALTDNPPGLTQAILVEEGSGSDEAIDIGKFQNLTITVILVAAYASVAIAAINVAASPAALTTLPGFDDTFVTLLAISHAGYLGGKLPTRAGVPPSAIEFSPAEGRPGEPVTIGAGIDLRQVTEARFGDSPNFAPGPVLPTGQLQVLVPDAAAPGDVHITLVTPTWSSTSERTFRVLPR